MPSPICFEHGLTPSPLRTETNLSTCSIDSACNLTGQGDFVQGSSNGYLPTFHSSNQPQGISPDRSSSFRPYLKIAFYGWRIAMGSCMRKMLYWFNLRTEVPSISSTFRAQCPSGIDTHIGVLLKFLIIRFWSDVLSGQWLSPQKPRMALHSHASGSNRFWAPFLTIILQCVY